MMDELVRKQDAIDAALTFLVEYCGAAFDEDMQKMLCERLDSLPSVEPERKKGQWIDTDNYYQRWKCSECGCHTRDAKPNYCSNCGARMEIRNNE